MTLFGLHNTRSAKLTPTQVQEIRAKYFGEKRTQSSLAREYQISVNQIGRIIRNESWQQYTNFEGKSVPIRGAEPVDEETLRRSQEILMEKLAEKEHRDPLLTPEVAELARKKYGTTGGMVQVTRDVIAEDSPGVRRFMEENRRLDSADQQVDELLKGEDK